MKTAHQTQPHLFGSNDPEQLGIIAGTNAYTNKSKRNLVEQKQEISKAIRKMRAQALWSAFAREMTSHVTKSLSIINPDSEHVTRVDRIYPRGAVSTASKTLKRDNKDLWGFNQQVDFILRILQDGLYCLDTNSIEQIINQVDLNKTVSERFSSLTKQLQQKSIFGLTDDAYNKIDQVIPELFAYDNNDTADKGDKRRLYKLARILFFIRFYENQSEDKESFSVFFCEEIDKVLRGYKNDTAFSPSTKKEQSELFTLINKHFDNTIIERSFKGAVDKFCTKSSHKIFFKTRTNSKKNKNKKNSPEESFYTCDNRHAHILRKLSEELAANHSSMVGGRDYTRMRFPEAILKSIALQKTPVLVLDGTAEEALEYVKENYTSQAKDVLEVGVCGEYGDFAEIFFKYQVANEIRQLFVIAQRGESRVLSNAASLVLYAGKKDTDGNLLPLPTYINSSNITCVYRTSPLNEFIKEEITDLLTRIQDEASILGELSLNIPTVVMPATSADTIVESLKNNKYVEEWTDHRFETIGKVSVVVLKDPKNNQQRRVIIPAVGGSGLYGDTAGIFIEEYLKIVAANDNESLKLNLLTDIKFFATAGALVTDTFLQHEGTLCSPTESFVSYDFNETVTVPIKKITHPAIVNYKNHGWAPCPAVETSAMFPLIEQNSGSAFNMIDVEGLFIAKSLSKLQALVPATFSPIYYVSDLIKKPAAGFDPMVPNFDSYAYGCRVGMAIRLSNKQLDGLVKYLFS